MKIIQSNIPGVQITEVPSKTVTVTIDFETILRRVAECCIDNIVDGISCDDADEIATYGPLIHDVSLALFSWDEDLVRRFFVDGYCAALLPVDVDKVWEGEVFRNVVITRKGKKDISIGHLALAW